MKSNKAPGIYGLTAEHLKFGTALVVEAATQVTNNTFISGKLPPQFKLGALTLIPKPRKIANNKRIKMWHNAILVLIYNQGIKGNLWNIYRTMYSDITSQVKLKGELVREIQARDKQSGLTSSGLFKSKANSMLNRISSHPLAYRINSIQVGAPTTADDTVFIISSRIGAQTLMIIGVAQCDTPNKYTTSIARR